MDFKFYPIDVEYNNGMRIFGRLDSGKRAVVLDNSLKPFFYAVPEQKDMEKLAKKIESLKSGDNFVEKTEIVDRKFIKESVKAIKIYVNTQSAIPVISDLVKEMGIKKRLEIDVPFYKKYLIEKNITPLTLCEVSGDFNNDPDLGFVIEGEVRQFSEDMLKPRILSFDIEVYSFSSIEDSAHPIVSLALAGENFKKVITWKKFETDKKEIEFVKNEAELITKFKDILDDYKPDYLVGYYSDGFDLPYIMQRASKYGLFLDLGLDGSAPKISRGNPTNVKIKGIVHLDILQFIKKIMSGSLKLDSYSLNEVANELLKEGKKEFSIRNMSSMWDNEEIDSICGYNLHDAVLTYKITEKLLPNMHELVKLVGMPLFEVSRMSYGQLV